MLLFAEREKLVKFVNVITAICKASENSVQYKQVVQYIQWRITHQANQATDTRRYYLYLGQVRVSQIPLIHIIIWGCSHAAERRIPPPLRMRIRIQKFCTSTLQPPAANSLSEIQILRYFIWTCSDVDTRMRKIMCLRPKCKKFFLYS